MRPMSPEEGLKKQQLSMRRWRSSQQEKINEVISLPPFEVTQVRGEHLVQLTHDLLSQPGKALESVSGHC